MKPLTALLALGGACAACCALPLAVGAGAAGLGLGGLTLAAGGWPLRGVAAAGIGVGTYAFARRRKQGTAANCASSTDGDSCGCASVPSFAKGAELDNTTIACSLGAGDFKERTAWIRDLTRRHLQVTTRTRLSLTLTYAPGALADVREMVRKEQTCCAFLTFDLREAKDGVHLTITAPERAREAADVLFDHFTPDLASAA